MKNKTFLFEKKKDWSSPRADQFPGHVTTSNGSVGTGRMGGYPGAGSDSSGWTSQREGRKA